MRYLAVDPGGVRMGLAVGDDASGVASPHAVVAYRGAPAAADRLAALAAELEADAVVVGLPTSVDGEPTGACARSRALARELEARGVVVHLQREYLSTNEARRRARAAGRASSRAVDDIAAQVLLEEFLAGLRCAGS